jgi:hypothetical protein
MIKNNNLNSRYITGLADSEGKFYVGVILNAKHTLD